MAIDITSKGRGSPDFSIYDQPRVFTITSDKKLHFTGSIAQNSSEQENITGLKANKIKITGATIKSKQRLWYRLLLFGSDDFTNSDLGTDKFSGSFDFNIPSYKLQGADVGQVGEVIDSLAIEGPTFSSNSARIVNVEGDIYLIVYSVSLPLNYKGIYSATVTIDSTGEMHLLKKQILYSTVTTTSAQATGLLSVIGADNIFAFVGHVTGGGADRKNVLYTLHVDTNSGSITIIDTLVKSYPSSLSYYPSIVNLEGTTNYAWAYTDSSGDGNLQTVSIDSDGTITAIDSWQFDGADGRYPYITHITGNLYTIMYAKAAAAGWIKSLRINKNGTITKSFLDQYNFGVLQASHEMINIDGIYYIVPWIRTTDSYMVTVSVSSAGTINNVDSWKYVDSLQSTRMVSLGDNGLDSGIMLLVLSALNNSSNLFSFEALDTGTITQSIKDEQFLSSPFTPLEVIRVSRDLYVVSYVEFGVAIQLATVIVKEPVSYSMSLNNLNIYYEDLDKTKELHIELVNLSSSSKSAGDNGDVILELKYEIMN